MASRVHYRLAEGLFTLPVVYGEKVLRPGESCIVADTVANVVAALNISDNDAVSVTSVPDGQTGAITPGTVGATSAAAAAGSATAAAGSANSAALSASYTGGTPAFWTGGTPTTVQNAMDRIAAFVKAGGTGPIPRT
jgi:hypothetical protein